MKKISRIGDPLELLNKVINREMFRSFMRFLGLDLCDPVPDTKTIWKLRNDLSQTDVMEELFCLFDKKHEFEGFITHKGTLVDATFVDAPRQRNSRDENKKIKEGEIPEEWKKPGNAAKMVQKDTDARWTKKNNEVHYGYKDHVILISNNNSFFVLLVESEVWSGILLQYKHSF